MIFPVVLGIDSSTHHFSTFEEVKAGLKESFASESFSVEMKLASAQTFHYFGTRDELTLRQIAEGKEEAFCLSKRKQTFHQLTAGGKSVVVPHHQILQKEDAELILFSILEEKEVPDAYHLEQITS